ncbi:zinc-dependent alcohol dehydrogenase family protein [Advenella sp. S44]|uniref:zinc-dependent alcohol dehydrogenase family protein n=1 Tax=Advenella sp. S44 TaxID=1982755 RepID=UPI001F5B21C9|nr:zinc-dependent alcohol dehydrogenase family protein [Advenella sp. S44]
MVSRSGIVVNNLVLRYRSFGPPHESLMLEEADVTTTTDDVLRVAMSVVPVNPSDLIPVTGAYAHRIQLPAIAGYEGVGVVINAPSAYAGLVGRRVLPLRGPGTWQRFVDCDPAFAVTVPNDVDDLTAARSYINPLAALRMLKNWPVQGKRVLLTGAGSTCANLLGLWARLQGAAEVVGIYRSHSRAEQIRELGIIPLALNDSSAIKNIAAETDITFDALGGTVAISVIDAMKLGSTFVGYGLLSGCPVVPSRQPRAQFTRFHLRDELVTMESEIWQQQFQAIWPLLLDSRLPETRNFPLSHWRRAIKSFAIPGRKKPMIDFRRCAI